MLTVIVSLILGALLLGSAVLKLADGPRTRAALGTYGITGARGQAGVGGADRRRARPRRRRSPRASRPPRGRAAALCGVFALAQAAVLMSGRGGAPCACFGARGRVGRGSLARASVLAVAFAVLPALDRDEPSTEGWLAIGLAAALLAIAALAVAVLALARELGALRAEIDPRGALEIPEEGPELGGRSELMEVEPGRLGLAVFTSEGCGMCRALEPAIEALGRDPLVRLRTFDEVRDAHAWAAAGIPGSPFAVARRRGRHGAREGDLQHRRAARVRARHGGAAARMNESRRGFLAKVSGSADGGHRRAHGRLARRARRGRGVPLLRPHLHDRLVPAPDRAAADRLQGPAAAGQGRPPRRRPRPPRRPRGRPGRRGRRRLTDAEGVPLPAASRTPVCKAVAEQYDMTHPHRRRLVPLLRRPRAQARGLLLAQRGGASTATGRWSGYCYKGRRVFCVMYFQTKVPC